MLRAKERVFVALKTCYSQNRNLIYKVCAGIEFACVSMLKLYDSAESK
jgi:hypothetical protein